MATFEKAFLADSNTNVQQTEEEVASTYLIITLVTLENAYSIDLKEVSGSP